MSEITHLKEQFLPCRDQLAAITNISCFTLLQLNCHQLLTLFLHVLDAWCDGSGWAPLPVLVNKDKGTLTFGPRPVDERWFTRGKNRAAYWAPDHRGDLNFIWWGVISVDPTARYFFDVTLLVPWISRWILDCENFVHFQLSSFVWGRSTRATCVTNLRSGSLFVAHISTQDWPSARFERRQFVYM
jgi:hypothetical protein